MRKHQDGGLSRGLEETLHPNSRGVALIGDLYRETAGDVIRQWEP